MGIDQIEMSSGLGGPGELIGMIQGGVVAQLIASSIRLGIPEALGRGTHAIGEVATKTGISASLLRRMLRALASLGLVDQVDDERFALSGLGSFLRRDVPGSQAGTAMLFNDPACASTWTIMDRSYRTGLPAFDEAIGIPIFDYYRQPDRAPIYNDAMHAMTSVISDAVASTYDFSGVKTFADIGGNSGALTAAVLKRNPHLHGTIFDLPGGIVGAVETLAENGVGDRCDIETGDFFVSVPEGRDLYMMKSIIHDWDDEKSIAILSSCRRAMPANGKLLLIETVLPEIATNNPKARSEFIQDVVMLVTSGGQERSPSEFDRILEPAGLKRVNIIKDVAAAHCIVEVVPV